MPFYEYCATDADHSCSYCKDGFEICQSIKSSKIRKCPECKSSIVKMISRIGGVVVSDRAANQYSDILKAKYWRDHNGVRHKVTAGDGHSGSGTVSKKQIRTTEEVAAIKKLAKQQSKQKRTQQSYQKFVNRQKARRK